MAKTLLEQAEENGQAEDERNVKKELEFSLRIAGDKSLGDKEAICGIKRAMKRVWNIANSKYFHDFFQAINLDVLSGNIRQLPDYAKQRLNKAIDEYIAEDRRENGR